MTNCQHFMCHRCLSRYPKGQCPRCQKPCKTILLSAPNVPKELMERLQYDVKKQLSQAAQALELQQRLEQAAAARLKEMVTTFNQQLRHATQQVSELQQQLGHKTEECKTLQVEVNVLRDQLREVHHGPVRHATPMAPSVQHAAQMQRASESLASFGDPFSSSSQQVSSALHSAVHLREPSAPPSPFAFQFSTEAADLAGLAALPTGGAGRPTWSPASTPLGWGTSASKRARDHSQAADQGQRLEQRFHLATPTVRSAHDTAASGLVSSSVTRASVSGALGMGGGSRPVTPHHATQRPGSVLLPKLQSLLPAAPAVSRVTAGPHQSDSQLR